MGLKVDSVGEDETESAQWDEWDQSENGNGASAGRPTVGSRGPSPSQMEKVSSLDDVDLAADGKASGKAAASLLASTNPTAYGSTHPGATANSMSAYEPAPVPAPAPAPVKATPKKKPTPTNSDVDLFAVRGLASGCLQSIFDIIVAYLNEYLVCVMLFYRAVHWNYCNSEV